MLRYVAALIAWMLFSVSLADGLDPSRDGNLRPLQSFCPYVWIGPSDSVAGDMKQVLQEQLQDKALLYDLPLHSPCKPGDAEVAIIVITQPGTFSIQLAVVPQNDPNWASPTIWSETLLASNVSDLQSQLRDTTTKVFEDFVLAWKKQRQP